MIERARDLARYLRRKIVDFGVGKVLALALAALLTGTVAADAAGVDVFDSAPTTVAVPVLVEEVDGSYILIDILEAALDDPVFGDISVTVDLSAIQAMLDAAIARIIEAYVPPGPPIKVDDIRDTVEDNNCLLKSGRPCPEFPESVTG